MEIKELTAIPDLIHLLTQDILLYLLMGGVNIQKKPKNLKGNS